VHVVFLIIGAPIVFYVVGRVIGTIHPPRDSRAGRREAYRRAQRAAQDEFIREYDPKA
jgi:hypothetical protein